MERPVNERAVFLVEACAGDNALRREVESLLAQPASAKEFLGEPALVAAAQLGSDIGASVLTGRRLGIYQVYALLGAGGMGEVYRARDTKVGRDVAIKILPRLFTSDPDRLARFEREARVLATLNHPNIGAIYGLEESDGLRALVLELVEGNTLAERIQRGPVRLSEADGRTRAYMVSEQSESGTEALIISALDGSEKRSLAQHIPRFPRVRPAWAPDGHRIAYIRAGLFAPANLFVVDTRDGRERQVTRFTRAGQSLGRTLLYNSPASGSRNLWIMPLDAGTSCSLTDSGNLTAGN